MSQTASSLALVLRERWDSATIAKQWFTDDGPLKRIESIQGEPIGKQLQVGIWGDVNSGGYISTSVAGGTLGTATNVAVDQALYTLTQHFHQISLEFSALNQSSSNEQSLISGKNLEITNALTNIRNQCTRQLVTNGDGKVAACDTSGGSTIVPLIASPSGTAYGFDALQRNWLRPGAVVDIGTTADTDALVTATTVSAIVESATAPTITVGTSITTTNGTHFVYVQNPNSATAANPELNGLRNMVNTTGALGGVNPGVAGEEFWQAAARDTTTTVLSLDLLLNLQGKVQQKSGKVMTDCWTGIKQGNNFYALLQNQVRFPGESKMGAGGVSSVTWNDMEVTKWPAILDSDWYCLTLSDFCRITGSITEPTWMSQVGGDGSIGGIWNTGNTNFVDALAYAFQVGLRRRNTQAAATGLTA